MQPHLIILFLLGGTVCVAQRPEKVENLMGQLANAKQDTSRVVLMNQLCDYYRVVNQDSALSYGQRALRLATQIKDRKGEIRSVAMLGAVWYTSGNLPKALAMELKALQTAEQYPLESDVGWPVIFIGRIYSTLKDYPKALSYGKKERILFQDKYKRYKEQGAKVSLGLAGIQIGYIFEQMGQLDSALFYTQQAQRDLQQTTWNNTSSIYRNLGNIQAKSGKISLALAYYKTGFQVASKNDNHQAKAEFFIRISELYRNRNKIDSSIYYAKKGLSEAQQINSKKFILESASLLSELYESRDAKESLRYYKITNVAREGLFGAGNIQAMQQTGLSHKNLRPT